MALGADGNTERNLADPVEAEAALRRELERNPESAEAALDLGLLLFNQDREQEAVPFLERARARMGASDQAFLANLIRQAETRSKVDALWKAATTARVAPPPDIHLLPSKPCRQADLETSDFRRWMEQMRETPRLTRKLWEWCYTAQALHERGVLGAGQRGLGFAVGREPLVSLFAGLGCTIQATDLGAELAAAGNWVQTKQHAQDLTQLNPRALCPPEQFAVRVSYREVDMNHIPEDLKDFDFLWSCCALEHTGTLASGIDFVLCSLDCLKPGGIAVHTTEFNVSSATETIASGPSVLYRRADLEDLQQQLQRAGHHVELQFPEDAGVADFFVDYPPYGMGSHLKVLFEGYTVTAFGLIIQKARE